MEYFLKNKKKQAAFVVGFIILSGIYVSFHAPPNNFPLGDILVVTAGQSLQDITNVLYDARIIRSPFFFRTHVILLGGEKRVIAGDYLLNRKIGSADLAYRLVKGDFQLEPVKVTIPEGWNVFQISDYLDKSFINFDKKLFLSLAKENEGYLFPDTYFISPIAKSEVMIEMMKGNFTSKISGIKEIKSSSHTLKEIITMASIVELEASTTPSRRIVSGILWKRIALGMPLQVDSAFSYINGKNTYELTALDLKIDSPYNTYKYKGLPLTPIGNPGLDSIQATLSPIKTDYLYFLSSKSGVMYYAKTLEEHIKNRARYLNR